MHAPWERARARSVGVRRNVEMNKVRSTPNSLALASSLPGGGLLMRSKTKFSCSWVMAYTYLLMVGLVLQFAEFTRITSVSENLARLGVTWSALFQKIRGRAGRWTDRARTWLCYALRGCG